MKNWFVATYKINEIKRVESNLLNQGFKYYLPKLVSIKPNCRPKEEAMFPGYIFIKDIVEKSLSAQYTKGIKSIIKFGGNISYISEDEIKSLKLVEELSKLEPLVSKIKIGQEVSIKGGVFKGNIAKICTLPSKRRIGVLLHILGSKTRIDVQEKDLAF